MSKGTLFLTLLLIATITFFLSDRYKSVDAISADIEVAPVQIPIKDPSPIYLERDGYGFELMPLFDYVLNGLVLHTMDYDTWYSLSRTDQTFTRDFCMVWGDTVKAGSHKKLSVKQDSRWCWWSTNSNVIAHNNEIANNHLIASSPQIEEQIRSIRGGDQVRIYGKLVNVHAVAQGETEQYERQVLDLKTSTNRDDSGGGACEIMYVERIEILQEANGTARMINTGALIGLALILVWSMGHFILAVFGVRHIRTRVKK